MSSITSEHALGTAAHLPPGGLVAIAWCSVGVAGGFGEWACFSRCVNFGRCHFPGFARVGLLEEEEEISSDAIRCLTHFPSLECNNKY